MSHSAILPDKLRDHTERHPDRDALVFRRDSGSPHEDEHLTYGELDRRTRAVAARLQQEGDPKRPVLLLYPSTLDFVPAFLGCLYAGRVAIPAPLPTEQGERLSRVSGIVQDSAADVVLTVSGQHSPIAEWLTQSGTPGVSCLATDGQDIGDPDAWRAPGTGADDLAFLQYTSGSTSEPKGTMVTHGNLAANEETIHRALRTRPGQAMGGWLPMYHDMGLIGHLLQPLWVGGTSVMMAPFSFLKHPHQWLRLIHDYRIAVSAAPNFAYDLAARRVTDKQAEGLDLSCWERALNGAEPVRAETLRAFTERFVPYGLRPESVYPAYGMAEATLLVSASEPGNPPVVREVDADALEDRRLVPATPSSAGRSIVSSGRPRDVELLIVDPETYEVMPDGQVGEIWLRGASVAAGYWNRPDVTQETFDAATADGQQGFLRTGDMGVCAEGELYVTGRLKELLIHNGRNLYPQDIEGAVQDAGAPFRRGGGAVFGLQDPRTGHTHVVVVQEVRPVPAEQEKRDALAVQVQSVLTRQFQLPSASIVLARPGAVRKTTSGKIQRTLMRKLFLEGQLPAVHTRLAAPVEALVAASARPAEGAGARA